MLAVAVVNYLGSRTVTGMMQKGRLEITASMGLWISCAFIIATCVCVY